MARRAIRYIPRNAAFKFFTDSAKQEWLKKEGTALFAVRTELGEHPNIISYEDIAVEAKPYPYLALEFANGGARRLDLAAAQRTA